MQFWLAWLSAWVLMLLLAIFNGGVRDLGYGSWLDEQSAHQVSTLLLALCQSFVMWEFVRRQLYAGRLGLWQRVVVCGVGWLLLTVAFEFLFFHYVAGHAWSALWANYDLLHGRVWVLLLLWLVLAPYLFWRRLQHSRG